VAAIVAYDKGTWRSGEVSISIAWDMNDHYYAVVREQGHCDWTYEFIPQGWRPSEGTCPARLWRDAATGRPILAAVADGVVIPRDDPKPVPGEPDGIDDESTPP
jgi:hypothetical protein